MWAEYVFCVLFVLLTLPLAATAQKCIVSRNCIVSIRCEMKILWYYWRIINITNTKENQSSAYISLDTRYNKYYHESASYISRPCARGTIAIFLRCRQCLLTDSDVIHIHSFLSIIVLLPNNIINISIRIGRNSIHPRSRRKSHSRY